MEHETRWPAIRQQRQFAGGHLRPLRPALERLPAEVEGRVPHACGPASEKADAQGPKDEASRQ